MTRTASPATGPLSHDDLCRLAVKWLQRSRSRQGPGCQVAFSEARNGYTEGEIPDAIGFRAGVCDEASVVVEVKVSRSDFFADLNKPHRVSPESGMGRYRYYMAPEGLQLLDDLPAKWGLLEVTPKGVIKVARGHVLLGIGDDDHWLHEHRNADREIGLLARMLMRFDDLDGDHRLVKDLRKRNAHLVNSNSALTTRVKELSQELYIVRHNEQTRIAPVALPRRVRTPVGSVPAES